MLCSKGMYVLMGQPLTVTDKKQDYQVTNANAEFVY